MAAHAQRAGEAAGAFTEWLIAGLAGATTAAKHLTLGGTRRQLRGNGNDHQVAAARLTTPSIQIAGWTVRAALRPGR